MAFARVYPEDFWTEIAALKQARHRDPATRQWVWSPAPPSAIETAIRFLEADLVCFRSGYVKERLIRHLVRQPLGADAERRLRTPVMAALMKPMRREFRDLCRLAVRVADDDLLMQIEALARDDDAALARRAGWMRDAVLNGRRDGRARQRPADRR